MLDTHEAQCFDLGILAMPSCQRLNFIFRQNDVCSHVVTLFDAWQRYAS